MSEHETIEIKLQPNTVATLQAAAQHAAATLDQVVAVIVALEVVKQQAVATAVKDSLTPAPAPAPEATPLMVELDYAITHGWPVESLVRLEGIRNADKARGTPAQAQQADLQQQLWDEKRQHEVTRGELERTRLVRDELLAATKAPAQAQQAEALTDVEIERAVTKAGGAWNGDHWIFEDADLHPFVRTLLAAKAVPFKRIGDVESDEISDMRPGRAYREGWNACRAAMLAANPAQAQQAEAHADTQDAERLDWLESQKSVSMTRLRESATPHAARYWCIEDRDGDDLTAEVEPEDRQTLREAIDAARGIGASSGEVGNG